MRDDRTQHRKRQGHDQHEHQRRRRCEDAAAQLGKRGRGGIGAAVPSCEERQIRQRKETRESAGQCAEYTRKDFLNGRCEPVFHGDFRGARLALALPCALVLIDLRRTGTASPRSLLPFFLGILVLLLQKQRIHHVGFTVMGGTGRIKGVGDNVFQLNDAFFSIS